MLLSELMRTTTEALRSGPTSEWQRAAHALAEGLYEGLDGCRTTAPPSRTREIVVQLQPETGLLAGIMQLAEQAEGREDLTTIQIVLSVLTNLAHVKEAGELIGRDAAATAFVVRSLLRTRSAADPLCLYALSAAFNLSEEPNVVVALIADEAIALQLGALAQEPSANKNIRRLACKILFNMKIHERRQIAPVVGRLVHPISPSRRERITAALRSYSPLGLMGRRPSGGAGSSTEEPVIVQGHVIEGAAHLGIGDDLLELLLHASSNNDRSGL